MTLAAGKTHAPAARHKRPVHHHWLFMLAVAIAALVLVASAVWLLREGRGVEEVGARPPTDRPASAASPPATQGPESRIELRVGALTARRMEAVLLTGRFDGEPGTALRVQRLEGPGRWVDFPLPAVTDPAGRFRTYVELNRPGMNKVRLVDPTSGAASEAFTIEVR